MLWCFMSPPVTLVRNFNTTQQYTAFIDQFPPVDILRLICSFLDDPKDVVHFGLANRRLNIFLSDTELWKSFLHKYFPSACVEPKLKVGALNLYKYLRNIERNIKTGKYQYQMLIGHRAFVSCAVIWNGKLISGSYDASIKIWDFNTGEQLQTLQIHHNSITRMTIYGDKLIFASRDSKIRIWDLGTELQLQSLEGHLGSILCIRTWGDKLISGSEDGTIKIWDLGTGQELRTLRGHQGWVNCIAIWGDKLISGSDDCTVKIWNPYTGKELQTLVRLHSWINCMTIWNDKLIFGLENNIVKIWDLNSGKELRSLERHHGPITCMAIWNDKLISGSSDYTMKIWDFDAGQELYTLDHLGEERYTLNEDRDWIACIVIANDEMFISSSVNCRIKTWNFNNVPVNVPMPLPCSTAEGS